MRAEIAQVTEFVLSMEGNRLTGTEAEVDGGVGTFVLAESLSLGDFASWGSEDRNAGRAPVRFGPCASALGMCGEGPP